MAKLPGVSSPLSLSFARTDAADADDGSSASSVPEKHAISPRAPKRLPRWEHDAVMHMAHELRNALQPALGFTQILMNPDHNQNLTAEQRGYLQRVCDAVQQMESMIRFMSEEMTPAQLHYHLIAPGKLLLSCYEQLLPSAQQKDISLQCDVPPRLPKAKLDRERVMQILMNLGGNAVKFAPPHSTVTLGAHEGREKNTIELFVHDEGAGVPKRYQAAIFHPFYRMPQPPGNTRAGRGLGLAIVDQLVALMGGKVWVESARRQGCTFWVQLPLAPPE